MSYNSIRTRGRASQNKLDRGGAVVEQGAYIGEVRNVVDSTKTGKIQVYIEEFSGPDKDRASSWISVSYISPFYGATEHSGGTKGTGDYVGNRHSYGFWFTPPEIGTKVLCFFASGDPNQGFYVGCIPQSGLTHMLPAAGASKNLKNNNNTQASMFAGADRLPVTEINEKDAAISEDKRFFDKDKPVHSYLAAILMQQGLVKDSVRGAIGSSAQRESPSRVFGVSSPGRPIYDGGLMDEDIKEQIESGAVSASDMKVIGRRGGHSFVMDDGDVSGNDQLLRLRTSKGHQILMSDDGDFLHFIHANGHSWFELGKEGTIDFFSTNSVNIRTQGMINFHADNNINMYSGGEINMYAKKKIHMESNEDIVAISKQKIVAHGKESVDVLSDGTIQLKANGSTHISSAGTTYITGAPIKLNTGGAAAVSAPTVLTKSKNEDVIFDETNGWHVKESLTETTVKRMPTHEPYPSHNKGVEVKIDVKTPPASSGGAPSAPMTSAVLNQVHSTPSSSLSAGTSDFVSTPKATNTIGPLSPDDLTGMISQRAKDVAQGVAEISEKGIGKFGISPQALEDAGILKPGTVSTFMQTGANVADVLSTAAVWTGKLGISDLDSLLASEETQVKIQETVMTTAYETLNATGIIGLATTAAELGPILMASVSNGVNNVGEFLVNGVENAIDGAIGGITSTVTGAIRSAQQAIDFVTQDLPEAFSSSKDTVEHIGTIARNSVDATVSAIIENAKVSLPIFSAPFSSIGLSANAMLNQAKDLFPDSLAELISIDMLAKPAAIIKNVANTVSGINQVVGAFEDSVRKIL